MYYGAMMARSSLPVARNLLRAQNTDAKPRVHTERGLLMIQQSEKDGAELEVMLNWLDELKRLVPANN